MAAAGAGGGKHRELWARDGARVVNRLRSCRRDRESNVPRDDRRWGLALTECRHFKHGQRPLCSNDGHSWRDERRRRCIDQHRGDHGAAGGHGSDSRRDRRSQRRARFLLRRGHPALDGWGRHVEPDRSDSRPEVGVCRRGVRGLCVEHRECAGCRCSGVASG